MQIPSSMKFVLYSTSQLVPNYGAGFWWGDVGRVK